MFEARERRQNDQDTETLQRIFAVPEFAGTRHPFGRPDDEPLLWLPDHLVGVIGTHLRGEGDRHLDRLVADITDIADITVPTIDITARQRKAQVPTSLREPCAFFPRHRRGPLGRTTARGGTPPLAAPAVDTQIL